MKRYKSLKEQIDLSHKKYKPRYSNDVLIWVSPKKLLDRLSHDDPDFDIRKRQIGNRLEAAKEFIQKYWNDPKVVFEPSVVSMNDGTYGSNKISFGDGRHRVLASYELGIPEIMIEVPKKQKELFKDLK